MMCNVGFTCTMCNIGFTCMMCNVGFTWLVVPKQQVLRMTQLWCTRRLFMSTMTRDNGECMSGMSPSLNTFSLEPLSTLTSVSKPNTSSKTCADTSCLFVCNYKWHACTMPQASTRVGGGVGAGERGPVAVLCCKPSGRSVHSVCIIILASALSHATSKLACMPIAIDQKRNIIMPFTVTC